MSNVVQTVAELMEISAITAPKAVGKSFLVTKVLNQEECQILGKEMIKYGEKSGKKKFDRDGANVEHSEAILLIGMINADPAANDWVGIYDDSGATPNPYFFTWANILYGEY